MSQEILPPASQPELPAEQITTPGPWPSPHSPELDGQPEAASGSLPATPIRPTRRRRRRAYPARVEASADTVIAARSGQVAATPEDESPEHQPGQPLRRRPAAVPAATPVDHLEVPVTHRPFAHPSEEEFARILNFYGVQWLYEPRSFPLRWDGDRVVEMFTPDFYMPELDLYVELTTLKQSLVTDKNRKLREIHELYPDVQVKLLYRRDIHRLLAKYGFGPLAQADIPGVERVLFTKPQIERRVTELGRAISQDYTGQDLVLVGVLRGVFCFMADLMRQITLPLATDFMSVSYYGGSQDVESTAHINKGPDILLAGRHVLLVEDIVDTGMTLSYLLRYLQAQQPASVKVCALLDKRIRRLTDVKLDYVGFEAPDEFLVGYGLDYLERYRNMPFIGILRPGEPPQPRTDNRRKRSPR